MAQPIGYGGAMVRCLMAVVAAAFCVPGAATAFFDPITEACQPPVMTGVAKAIDGNTLTLATAGGGTIVIRLHAIDAPDMIQTCRVGEDIWDCGREAKATLAGLVDGRELACLACGVDERGRTLATCLDGETDIGVAMVRSGMALGRAFFSNALNASQARAKIDGIGMWRGDFVDPDAWRRGERLGEEPCRGCTSP
ncbi:MAG: thermonuclease family protein [Pseudomonadota bacterium]